MSLGRGYRGGWQGWQTAGPSLGKLQEERAGTRLGDRSPGMMAPELAACRQPSAPALGRQIQLQHSPAWGSSVQGQLLRSKQ